MIKIERCIRPISNCNVCGAVNFDQNGSYNQKVDNLTDVWIGQDSLQNITLCDECLAYLHASLIIYVDRNL